MKAEKMSPVSQRKTGDFKKYTFVAWTGIGQVRMVPSLINDAAESYRERIARLDSLCEGLDEIKAWRFGRQASLERKECLQCSAGTLFYSMSCR